MTDWEKGEGWPVWGDLTRGCGGECLSPRGEPLTVLRQDVRVTKGVRSCRDGSCAFQNLPHQPQTCLEPRGSRRRRCRAITDLSAKHLGKTWSGERGCAGFLVQPLTRGSAATEKPDDLSGTKSRVATSMAWAAS